MTIDIPEQFIGGFLLRIIAILLMIGVGALLLTLLQGIAEKYPFTRIGLSIGLPPLIFLFISGSAEIPAILLHSFLTTLAGLSIDGANHILQSGQTSISGPKKDDAKPKDSGKDGLVWEKAE